MNYHQISNTHLISSAAVGSGSALFVILSSSYGDESLLCGHLKCLKISDDINVSVFIKLKTAFILQNAYDESHARCNISLLLVVQKIVYQARCYQA